MINDIEKQYIYQTIREKLQPIHPNRITVFGSFAKNEDHSNSDIDLLIEMNTDLPFIKRTLGIRRLLKEIPYPFDLLIYTPEEVATKLKDSYSVVFQAYKEGIRIDE